LPQAATRVPVRRRSGTRWWRSGRRWGTSAVELSGRRRLGHGGIVWWLGGGGGTRGPPRPTGGLASGGGEDVAGTPSGGGTPDATREPRGGRRVSGKRQLACNTKCTTSPSKLNVAKVLTTGVAGQLSALAGGEEHVFHGLNVIPYDVEASLLASLPPSDHPCFSCSGGAVGAMPPSMAAAAAVDVVPRGPNPNSTGGELAARQPSLPPSPPNDVIPSDTDVDARCSRLPPRPVDARGPSPLPAPTAPRPRPRRSPSPTPRRHRPRPRMQTRRAAGVAAPLSILALTWHPRCERARCTLFLRAAPRSLRSHTPGGGPSSPHARGAWATASGPWRRRAGAALQLRQQQRILRCLWNHRDDRRRGHDSRRLCGVLAVGHGRGAGGRDDERGGDMHAARGRAARLLRGKGGGGAAREEGVVSSGVDNLGLEERRFSIHR
jgi:hypothetical protein